MSRIGQPPSSTNHDALSAASSPQLASSSQARGEDDVRAGLPASMQSKANNFAAPAAVREKLTAVRTALGRVIRGKIDRLDVIIVALLANGSVLMEDVPGVGKTTLAKAVAKVVDLSFHRVQFTPDLLPTDILGSSIYTPGEGTFKFRPGPIFCNVLLADEINRASPRTQSALLEAMSESQTTIEGERYPLPAPFFVLATQNPVDYHGTYPLPEAQLDRFFIYLNLGYPDAATELSILFDQVDHHPLDDLKPVLLREELLQLQTAVRHVRVEESIAKYVVNLTHKTRDDSRLQLGVSPRGSLMLFRAGQACAYLQGRDYVVPDDIQAMASSLLSHRVILTSKSKYGGLSKAQVIQDIIEQVPVPT